ncbi:MAG: sulfotransferase [Actinobacteria bacterium]|nr:MAG: sulfotransferase [Actinomycetota bacterium]
MATAPRSQETTGSIGRRLPEFFIVGHAKCGTTALYEMLRQHPRIYMPAHKEPWFYSRDNPHPQTTNERSIAFTGRRSMSLDEYLSLFSDADSDQLIGEASTSYIWSATAARAIAEAQPSARIIALFREPASFLHSLHLQLLTIGSETEKDLRKAISLDDARREGRNIPASSYWPQALIYSDRVRYVEQLQRYRDVFPPEQILVLIYDDFRADNQGTLREVLRFLDADETASIDALEAHPTVGVRSVRLHSMTRAVAAGRGPLAKVVRRTAKAVTTRALREDFVYPLRRRLVYTYPKPPDEQLMRELRERFKVEVSALSEYLNRDLLKLWRYDELT